MTTPKKSILVVEDNLVAAKVTKHFFEELGCKVELANDGDVAVQMVKDNHYDGISMDIGMDKMSGVEACIAIREYEAQNNLKPVPIIAVTGNNSEEEAKEYKMAGMQKVLDKPINLVKAKHLLSFIK